MELIYLFFGAFVSGMLAWAINIEKPMMKLILAFSGAFMLGLSFFHVLPESYEAIGHQAGIWVLVGFMIQIMLEVLSKGMEHGHAHALHGNQIPFALLVGLGLHSLLEGLPFGGEHAHEHHSLLAGIIIHNVPVAFILGTVLRGAGYSMLKGALAMAGFAFMSPLGGIVAYFLEGRIIEASSFQGIVQAAVVGVFLHIATTIIFETDKGHAFNLKKFSSILLGFLIAYFAV
ncbi:MAG: ZIP family metal transporter [Flavobacteriales bacterium]|nr:ZIP family metal transporter [Flavobacteriales bacterium]